MLDRDLASVGNAVLPSHGGGGAQGTWETCRWRRTRRKGRWETRRLGHLKPREESFQNEGAVDRIERWRKMSSWKQLWDLGLDKSSLVEGVGKGSG